MGIKLTGKETKLGKIPIDKEPFGIDLEETETSNFDVEGVSRLTLFELSKRNMAIEIYSEILNCNIWICSNEEMVTQVKKDDPKAVTYSVRELRELIRLHPHPKEIRRIHDTKIVFEGSKIVGEK